MNTTWLVFSVLSELNRGTKPENISCLLRERGSVFYPRIPAWLRLLQAAGLLNNSLHATPFFYHWLCLQPAEQARHLVTAWGKAPRPYKNRLQRKRILLRLLRNQDLQDTDQLALPVLRALGICSDNSLSRWGRVVLGNEQQPTPISPANWQVKNKVLIVPYPVNWTLLWKLEKYLQPTAVLEYPLDDHSLRLASQCGEPEGLITILEEGTGSPLPPSLLAAILAQPTLGISSGIVLEFSSPEELHKLRRNGTMRKYFEQVLSPRHVLVNAETSPSLLKLLQRRGVYVQQSNSDEPSSAPRRKRTHFARLKLLEPYGDKTSTRTFLEQNIRQQTALDMLYHAPGSVKPETRRITPLVIEERGGHSYVSAYCHTRKGNRIFRLDRMEIPGTVNAG